MGLLVTIDFLTLLRWDGESYRKQKFNVTNFKEVLTCLEMIRMEANECSTKWTRPSVDILHLSESMQSLKLEDDCEDFKSVLPSMREELKNLNGRVKALEDQISDEIPEEQREMIPEDLLTMLPPTIH